MVLGDPGQGQIHGYAHVGHGAALVFLRNPSLESQVLRCPLPAVGILPETGAPEAAGMTVSEVYPARAEVVWDPSDQGHLHMQILACQTRCLAIVWDGGLRERAELHKP